MPIEATYRVLSRALKRGTYRLEFQVGQDAKHLGVVMARTIKLT